MRRVTVTTLFALICAMSLGCKDGSEPTEDAGMDASLDGGAGGTAGTAGTGGTAGIGGTGGVGGNAGIGGEGGRGGAGGGTCEFTICPTGCVDLDTDDQNCGSCGNICEETDVCAGGTCVPG